MKCLVTGAAGFIGSTLCEKLLGKNYSVTGIDSFTDYYSKKIKEDNLKVSLRNPFFRFVKRDILETDLKNLLKGFDFIFHQAAQAGVRGSWGKNFGSYTRNNILGTQKLLEALKGKRIKKFIYASSSSVYGDVDDLPITENTLPRPVSPYGVTKLAAEHLVNLYCGNYGIPVVSLRYFSVYGPRQRPDMAFNKFIKAMLNNEQITVYGDGNQTRDFTYIDDIVRVNILAMKYGKNGEVFNVGGGSNITVKKVIRVLEGIIGLKAKVKYIEVQKGDVRHTFADISKAKKILGYSPVVKIEYGLEKEVSWLKKQE